MSTDPDGADFQFNLAISLKRQGDTAEALAELGHFLKLRPNDNEAHAVEKGWTGSVKTPVASTAASVKDTKSLGDAIDAKVDPLERIERSFDAAAFHQAALMLDQVEASRLDALEPRERAQKLSAQAHEYLEHGLLLEAERLYQSAAAIDGRSAEVHAGLAEIRERSGNNEAARREAVTSAHLMPSVDAYMVLGRLNIAAGRLEEAQQNADAALQIDPKSNAAQELKRQTEAGTGQKK